MPSPSTGPSGLQLPTFWVISCARAVTQDWLSGIPPSWGRLVPKLLASGGGRALGPTPPSWAGEGGSTR